MAQFRLNVQAPIERLLAERWSPRAFDPDRPVTREALASCLEAARWAPSCFGAEPWRFVVADRFEDEAAWKAVLACLAPSNRVWAERAPVFVVAAAEPRFAASGEPNRWSQYDLGQAAMSLLLQASALGLAAHSMGGFDADALKRALAIPKAFSVPSVTALGHPGDPATLPPELLERERALRRRRPLEESVFAGRWERAWRPPLLLGWEARYEEAPAELLPWFHPELDPDFAVALDRLGLRGGRALDLGCGPGTQAIALARRGFEVTAVDVAPAAIEGAKRRAAEAGVAIRFRVGELLSVELPERFDLALDRGVLHCFADEGERRRYVARIGDWLEPGGVLLLKCFSEEETREEGPPCRLSPDELRALFADGFECLEIRRSVFPVAGVWAGQEPPKALAAVFRRAA